MTYAYVQDLPGATIEGYDEITAQLGDERPAGLVVHLAGPTDDGIRFIDVWETEDDFKRFLAERLIPATSVVLAGAAEAPDSRTDVLDVHHRW
jgi:hypothetical protein